MVSQLSPEERQSRIRAALAESGILDQLQNPFPELTRDARTVLERRYLLKNPEGEVVEDPDAMFRRVAQNLSLVDHTYGASEAQCQATEEEFYRVMRGLEFLPSSFILMNAGQASQQLSGNFVLPVEDSLDSIFTAVREMAAIFKSGGGVGISLNRLRPEGDVVGSTGGIASGPVSFMRAFDTAADVIRTGGVRRGALRVILNVDHPDILKFIRCKEDGKNFRHLNITVAVTEEFIEKAKLGEDYDLVNPRTKKVTGQLNARKVFDLLAETAFKTGEPDVVFLDRLNRDNPTPQLDKINAVAPDEQALLPYESCVYGAINLARMIKDGDGVLQIDWDRMARVIRTAVHLLDNAIDVDEDPLGGTVGQTRRKTRRIAIGVMGFAELLIALGKRYDSPEAADIINRLMSFVKDEAVKASAELGEQRGAFPAWSGSAYDRPDLGKRVRNSALVAIVPTGTTSIIAGVSSGIEPLLALGYARDVADRVRLLEGNPYFDAVAKHEDFYSPALTSQLAQRGSLAEQDVPQWVKEVFKTSHDVSPEWHVRIQADFQQYTDNAVFKTINFPSSATVEDVVRIYLLAYELDCRSITIYRDASKADQAFEVGSRQATVAGKVLRVPRQRPRTIHGVTERLRTGHGNMYVTINFDEEGRPFEVFGTLGKAGGCDSAQLEAISRLVSLALRCGIEPGEVTSQLRGITCCPAWDQGTLIRSGPDAIALALERQIAQDVAPAPSERDVQLELSVQPREAGRRCPDCNATLAFEEGRLLCVSCGWNSQA